MRLNSVNGTCVSVEYLVMGMLENNVYVVSDGKATMVVDPTRQANCIVEALGGRTVDAIMLTHFHNDHIGAAAELRRLTGAPVIASALDQAGIESPVSLGMSEVAEPCPVDHAVADGDIVQVGDMPWKVLLTPGHSKGSMCWYIASEFGSNPEGVPVLLSGDTLFAGTIGRTDLPGGSLQEMRGSLKKLAMLPDETAVFPGHGGFTTIGAERRRVFAHYAQGE